MAQNGINKLFYVFSHLIIIFLLYFLSIATWDK